MQLSYCNDKKRMLVILSLMFIESACIESFILYYNCSVFLLSCRGIQRLQSEGNAIPNTSSPERDPPTAGKIFRECYP